MTQEVGQFDELAGYTSPQSVKMSEQSGTRVTRPSEHHVLRQSPLRRPRLHTAGGTALVSSLCATVRGAMTLPPIKLSHYLALRLTATMSLIELHTWLTSSPVMSG